MRRFWSILLCLIILSGCSEQAREAVPLVGGTLVDQDAIAKRQRIDQDLRDLASMTAVDMSQAIDAERAATTDPVLRRHLTERKIRNASMAWDLAFEPSPAIGILKLTTHNAVGARYLAGPAESGRTFSAAARARLAAASWRVAERHLPAEVIAEMRTLAAEWAIDNQADEELNQRLRTLGDSLVASANSKERKSSLLTMVSLDPFSGLDPAAKAIEASRRTAERALYLADKLPVQVRWQSELLVEDLALSPSGAQVLADLHRTTATAESLGQTIATLPDRISAERQALVADLASQEAKLATLAGEVRAALDSGNATLQSAEKLLITFNALMDRFAKPDHPDAKPGRPFDITEYERTATAIGLAAQRLDGAIATTGGVVDSDALDARLAQLQQAGDRLVLRATLALAGLILLAGAVIVAVRRLTR